MGWRNLPTQIVGWRKYRNLFLFLINTLLFYPSLSPHSQTDGVTEKQIHSLPVGWRNLPTLRVGWRKYGNLFLFLINTLLLYPSLSPYTQTDRQTDRESN